MHLNRKRYYEKLKQTWKRQRNHVYLEKTMNKELRAPFLYRILQVDFEYFASIKAFIFVWWSDSKRWWLVVATGCRGWWRKRG